MDAVLLLFEFRSGVYVNFAPYAVTRDKQRFLINEGVNMEPNAPQMVVVNGAAEVNK